MAKLKARGRTELFRMVRQEPPDAEGVERKTTYTFMSDGIVLRNQTTKHPAHVAGGHTWPASTTRTGWKVSNLVREHKGDFTVIEENLRLKGFVRGAQ